jgi:hypothetical protein
MRSVEFLMGFTRTLLQLHSQRGRQGPLDMDVDESQLDADDHRQGEDVTALTDELARSAQLLADTRAERDRAVEQTAHAEWHSNRLQGEKDVAEDLLRGLNVEFDRTVAEVGRLREEIRQHNEKCPNQGPTYISRAGRRWHFTRGCSALQSFPDNVEQVPHCALCTGMRMAP